MADTFIDEMEELLTTMRKELLEKMSDDNSDFKSMVNAMGGKDSVDIAADDIAFKKMEAINKHEANRLRSIDNALSRIHNGKYGLCLKCQKKIPEERLRAIPYSVLASIASSPRKTRSTMISGITTTKAVAKAGIATASGSPVMGRIGSEQVRECHCFEPVFTAVK